MPDDPYDFRYFKEWADSRYVRVDSSDHKDLLALIPEVKFLRTEIAETKESSWRNERRLAGGWNEDDTKYTIGMSAKFTIITFMGGVILAILIPVAIKILTAQIGAH